MTMTMITIAAMGIRILMRIPTAATATIITTTTGMARRIMITTTLMAILTITITIMTILMPMMRPVGRSIMAAALPASMSRA